MHQPLLIYNERSSTSFLELHYSNIIATLVNVTQENLSTGIHCHLELIEGIKIIFCKRLMSVVD